VNIVGDIRIEEVIDENRLTGRNRNLDTVRKVVYHTRVYSPSMGTWYDHQGNILVGVGYRNAFGGDENSMTAYKMPGNTKHVYSADMIIMTRFGCDSFTVPKNRWGTDGRVYSKGIELGFFLLGRGLDGFDMDSRERLWEKILQALSDVTGHPIDYIKDKERFMLEYKLKPRYFKKEFQFS
jgi:hypothetical protein